MNRKKSIGFYIKKQTFNLQNPIENHLARINSFYEVLNNIENNKLKILYDSVYYDNEEKGKEAKKIWKESKGKQWISLIDWEGQEDMGSFGIIYDYEKEKIIPGYSEYQYGQHIQGLEKGDEDDRYEEYTKEEFNLLMQIYFGLYQEKTLQEKLQEKERQGEYKRIKSLINENDFIKQNQERVEKYNKEIGEDMEKKQSWDYSRYTSIEKEFNKIILSKPEVQEYLKLELMKKDTNGAFDGLEIEKIYDKDWSEEKQRKHIDEINKEFREEVIVEE